MPTFLNRLGPEFCVAIITGPAASAGDWPQPQKSGLRSDDVSSTYERTASPFDPLVICMKSPRLRSGEPPRPCVEMFPNLTWWSLTLVTWKLGCADVALRLCAMYAFQ